MSGSKFPRLERLHDRVGLAADARPRALSEFLRTPFFEWVVTSRSPASRRLAWSRSSVPPAWQSASPSRAHFPTWFFRPFRIGHKVQIGAGSVGIVKELTLFWTEFITDDKVQVIVPNSGVWGQPLRNFSIYPAPPHATEVRFQIAADTELDSAVEQVRTLVKADPRVLGDPVPSVLLDRRAVDTLEIVAAFSTADDVAALVKSDLIKAVHTALDNHPAKQSAQPA